MDKSEWLFTLEVFGPPLALVILAIIVADTFWSATLVLFAAVYFVWTGIKYGPNIN